MTDRPRQRGWNAWFAHGATARQNPYPVDNEAHQHWEAGRLAAMEDQEERQRRIDEGEIEDDA